MQYVLDIFYYSVYNNGCRWNFVIIFHPQPTISPPFPSTYCIINILEFFTPNSQRMPAHLPIRGRWRWWMCSLPGWFSGRSTIIIKTVWGKRGQIRSWGIYLLHFQGRHRRLQRDPGFRQGTRDEQTEWHLPQCIHWSCRNRKNFMQNPELFACLSKERKENLLGTLLFRPSIYERLYYEEEMVASRSSVMKNFCRSSAIRRSVPQRRRLILNLKSFPQTPTSPLSMNIYTGTKYPGTFCSAWKKPPKTPSPMPEKTKISARTKKPCLEHYTQSRAISAKFRFPRCWTPTSTGWTAPIRRSMTGWTWKTTCSRCSTPSGSAKPARNGPTPAAYFCSKASANHSNTSKIPATRALTNACSVSQATSWTPTSSSTAAFRSAIIMKSLRVPFSMRNLTWSDCLDAATDSVGRAYSSSKNFADMLADLRCNAGRMFNPDLVQLFVSKISCRLLTSRIIRLYESRDCCTCLHGLIRNIAHGANTS